MCFMNVCWVGVVVRARMFPSFSVGGYPKLHSGYDVHLVLMQTDFLLEDQ